MRVDSGAPLGPHDPEGAIATTDHQTAGRGRLGRSWVEAPGTSVLVSVLLRPPAERRAQELSLVAAVAVALAVEDATGLSAQIKWPNDVLLARRKVAGILAEMRGRRRRARDRAERQPDARAAPARRARSRPRRSARSTGGFATARRCSRCCSADSTPATRAGARAGSTRSTTTSARATSSTAGG